MKHSLLLASLVILANGCIGGHSGSTGPTGIASGQHPEVVAFSTFPGFTVNIAFSERAKKTLVDSKETVVVAGYVTGFPKPGVPRQYVSHMGEVALGQVQKEFAPGGNVSFSEIRLRRDALERIDSHGPQLLVNVFSGRKSSENNLLDCDIYEGPLKDVQGRSIPISCRLIGE